MRLGVTLTSEKAHFLGAFDHNYDTNFLDKSGIETHYVSLAYEIFLPDEDHEFPDTQHSEYRWVSICELLQDEGVHQYTKDFFDRPMAGEASQLLTLYNTYQAGGSSDAGVPPVCWPQTIPAVWVRSVVNGHRTRVLPMFVKHPWHARTSPPLIHTRFLP